MGAACTVRSLCIVAPLPQVARYVLALSDTAHTVTASSGAAPPTAESAAVFSRKDNRSSVCLQPGRRRGQEALAIPEAPIY